MQAIYLRVKRVAQDMTSVNAGNSLASIGGFCAGDRDVVDHQRLSGLGYCFSASLPPYLATGAIQALERMQQKPETVLSVAQNARHMRGLLRNIPGLSVSGCMAITMHASLAPLNTDAEHTFMHRCAAVWCKVLMLSVHSHLVAEI